MFGICRGVAECYSRSAATLGGCLLRNQCRFSGMEKLIGAILVAVSGALASCLSRMGDCVRRLTSSNVLSLADRGSLSVIRVSRSPGTMFMVIPSRHFAQREFIALFVARVCGRLMRGTGLGLEHGRGRATVLGHGACFMLSRFNGLPGFSGLRNVIAINHSHNVEFLFMLRSFDRLGTGCNESVTSVVGAGYGMGVFVNSSSPRAEGRFSRLYKGGGVGSFSIGAGTRGPTSDGANTDSRPLVAIKVLRHVGKGRGKSTVMSMEKCRPV